MSLAGLEPRLSNISAGVGLVVVLHFSVSGLLVGVGPGLAVEEPRQVLVVVQLKDNQLFICQFNFVRFGSRLSLMLMVMLRISYCDVMFTITNN